MINSSFVIENGEFRQTASLARSCLFLKPVGFHTISFLITPNNKKNPK